MKTPRSDASIQWENRGGGHVLRLWQKNVYRQIALLKVSQGKKLPPLAQPFQAASYEEPTRNVSGLPASYAVVGCDLSGSPLTERSAVRTRRSISG